MRSPWTAGGKGVGALRFIGVFVVTAVTLLACLAWAPGEVAAHDCPAKGVDLRLTWGKDGDEEFKISLGPGEEHILTAHLCWDGLNFPDQTVEFRIKQGVGKLVDSDGCQDQSSLAVKDNSKHDMDGARACHRVKYVCPAAIPEGKQVSKLDAIYRGSTPDTVSNEIEVTCAVDKDGDTIPDGDDTCPEDPGPPENSGCPIPRGGIVELLVDSSGSPARVSEGGGAASFPFPAIAGMAAAAAAAALVAGGWYARRRFSTG